MATPCSTTDALSNSKTKGRQRFRLRTLLLFVSLVGLSLWYPAWIVRRSAQDQVLLRRLNLPEASVNYQQLGPSMLRWILPIENSRVVRSIHIWQQDGRETNWGVLQEFQHLKSVGLHAVNMRDEEFAAMGVLSHVEELEITHSPLTDRAIRDLARWPKLRRLNIHGTQATPNALRALRNAPALERVDTSYYSPRILSELGIKIDDLPFDLLIFPRSRTTEPQRTASEGSARLDVRAANINVSGEEVFVNVGSNWEDAHLSALRELPRVTKLSLHSKNVTDKGMAYLVEVPELRHLTLFAPNVTDDGMHTLSKLTELKSLFIADGDISDDGLQSISGMTGLTRLSIGLPMVTDTGLRTMGQCTNLESLSLNCNVTTDGLTFLPQLTKLRELHLGNTKIDDRIVPLLQQCPSLRVLHMSSGLCDDADLRSFASLTQLQVLSIMGGPFRRGPSAETHAFLVKSLPECKLTRF